MLITLSCSSSTAHTTWFFPTTPPMLPLTSSTNTMPRPTTQNNMVIVRKTKCSPLLPFCLFYAIVVIGRDLEYFSQAGFDMDKIHLKRNAPVALLYEDAIRNEGAIISSSGALINFSGKKTGRSPKDKRIVFEETSKDNIWWGSVNIKMDERMFQFSLIAVNSLSTVSSSLQTPLKSIVSVRLIISTHATMCTSSMVTQA